MVIQSRRAAYGVMLAALVLVFSASRTYAQAIILPGVTASVEAQGSSLLYPGNSFSTLSPPATLPLVIQSIDNGSPTNPGHAFARATVDGGLDPVVSVSVSAVGETTTNPNAQGSFIAGATAVLNYSFAIVGPDTAGTIPVVAQGDSSISQITYTGFQTVQIYTELWVNNGSVLESKGGPFNTTLNLHIGTVYNVHMEAQAVVDVLPDQAEAIAYVDPSFTIDPAFSNTYSITYSDGLIPLPGDANYDGKRDADDYFLIDRGFASGLTGWSNGDFNGDGKVDADDYFIIDKAFLGQGASVEVPANAIAVPEPGSLSLLVLSGLLFAGARRRNRR